MKFNAECLKPLLAALAVVTSFLAGCATASFDDSGVAACPPVGEYSREFRNRVTEELALLPDGSAVVEMMVDYAVLRDQARACR